jgi:hypothetical protein
MATARHGASGSTSPSTTGEKGVSVWATRPHRPAWSAGRTASAAARQQGRVGSREGLGGGRQPGLGGDRGGNVGRQGG